MKRVVVTGIGAVTPLGNSFSESWENAKAGRTGIGILTKIALSDMPWKVAGELKRFDAGTCLSAKEINRLDPFVHYAVAASLMAARDAGLIKQASEHKTTGPAKTSFVSDRHPSLDSGGVIIGSSRGGISTLERGIVNLKGCNSRLSPYLMPATTTSMASSYVAMKLGLKGYCLGISNACSSGTNAIGEAYRLIKSGYAGPVFAGGTEAPICQLCIKGYGISGALSKKRDSSASRPFDKNRDGFVLSEGACILVLENHKAALERGAPIYGEIMGYGNNTDTFHQTKPSSYGEAEAIRLAMEEAGVNPDNIDFISAHGTSTILGDRAESEAIEIVFAKMLHSIPVTSVKSMTGHMLAASGALEAAFTIMSLNEGLMTPTVNLREKDPGCGIKVITMPEKADIHIAVSNSFGFGGVNAVLVVKKIINPKNAITKGIVD